MRASVRLLLLLLLGCARAPTAASASAAPPTPAPAPRPTQAATSSVPPPSPVTSPPPPATSAFRACGEICKAFPSAEAAFDFALTSAPRVLAVGEAHAQAGSSGPSTTRRFMETLLPRLAPRASDLVIELWVGSGKCGKVEAKVAEQQAEVTAPQASTNQNEFLELGHRAKALGIQPHALVPTCEQYQRIANAGAGDIAEMMTMLRDVTERDVKTLLGKRPRERLIVAYGGALHNDLRPREGREDFSFGPALASATQERYVELDLVVPEQIKDSDAWRGLPWYPHYPRDAASGEAYLLSWAPGAYALIFPKASSVPVP